MAVSVLLDDYPVKNYADPSTSFYIVGVCWNMFAAIVIWFTYMETQGLTLEQIDQRFEGVPRSQLGNVIVAYNGDKPLSEAEIAGNSTDKRVDDVIIPLEINRAV